ncbi:MAG: hypothetical protein PHQ50_00375 [Eubacteriales bacterium]|nr:hypothetical protein [Eubacteriales bacterium]MDD3349346.1 hypothetical protein [Eubacteriales bacterium]
MKGHKKVQWARLDNASKIFPAVRSNKDPKVFRLSCELYEEVKPEILQQALELALRGFPLFRSVLRHGVFWYYFEESDIPPKAEKENTPVCAPIYQGDRHTLLFRVVYCNCRINLEVFHALTDGSGATAFMETLIYEYLKLAHGGNALQEIPDFKLTSSISKKADDSFEKHFVGTNMFKRKSEVAETTEYKRAYHIKGNKNGENRTRVVEGSMSLRSLLDLAHSYETTLTIFLASLLIYSIYREMPVRMRKYPVVLSVPVDLRNFFESATTRNFFCTIYAGCRFEKENFELKDTIDQVSKAFRNNLTKRQLYNQLDRLIALGQNPVLKFIPLPLKDFFLRIGAWVSARKISSAISNLGRITLPEAMKPFVKQFGVCTGARRPQINMCSFGDRTVITFTSPFMETDIQRNFFQFLSECGIDIEISVNF